MELVAKCNNDTATLNELQYLYEHDLQITFKTFSKHVPIGLASEVANYAVGSQRGLHLRRDWAVRFYRSKFRGKRCWHMVWSEIDHIYQEV
jgi:hypothetical protein